MIFGIDFDGTVVEHKYPDIGEAVPLALNTLKKLQENSHELILWTMRSDNYLDEAVKYLEDNGIKLFGINENPEQVSWTHSPKAYCHLYIDDAALGCPLIYPLDGRRPYVDWESIRTFLINNKLIIDRSSEELS